MSKDRESYKTGRNDRNGQYVPLDRAQRDREHYSVVHNPLPGHGTAKKDK